MEYIRRVDEFMKTMGQETPSTPTIPNEAIRRLRYKLIREENQELEDASYANNIVEVADALCDLRYVVEGAFRHYGFSPELADELFREVQASNMSKSCATIEEAVETRKALAKSYGGLLKDFVVTQVGER